MIQLPLIDVAAVVLVFLFGALGGLALARVRQRLLLEVLYAVVLHRYSSTAEEVQQSLAFRPWSLTAIASALVQLERMGILHSWDADHLALVAGQPRRRVYACHAVRPPGVAQ